MATGVNKVLLIGNVGKDAELRFTSGGTAVAKFSLATSEKFGKADNRQERTEWHRIVVWGKLAEFCGEWIKKGKQIFLEGRLQTREWEDKEGRKHSTTEIVAGEIRLLGGGRGPSTGGEGTVPARPAGVDDHPAGSESAIDPPTGYLTDEELPF